MYKGNFMQLKTAQEKQRFAEIFLTQKNCGKPYTSNCTIISPNYMVPLTFFFRF